MTRSLLFLVFVVGALPLAAMPEPRKAAVAPASATLVPLAGDWRIEGDLPVHALLISLQGLANRDQPRMYLEYPVNWQWEIVRPLITFLETRHHMVFDRLGDNDADAALDRFSRYAKGYVVWDRQVRSSLIVAFTAAGVLDGVVVDEKLIPLASSSS